MRQTHKYGFSWPLFILMGSITFLAILSELMPSGILPEMAAGFGITEAQAGGFVGQYAIASAIFGIPIVSATVEWDRKKLLMILLVGSCCTNCRRYLCRCFVANDFSVWDESCFSTRIRKSCCGYHGRNDARHESGVAGDDLDWDDVWIPCCVYCYGNIDLYCGCFVLGLFTTSERRKAFEVELAIDHIEE